MKILHLIHDNKFFDFVDEVFSALPGVQNRLVAFSPGIAPTVHIDALHLWRRVGLGYFISHNARKDLAWCDCLVVHFVEAWGALLMRRAPARVTVVWSGWGGDYLALLPNTGRELLLPETAALVERLRLQRGRSGLRERVRLTFYALVDLLVCRPLLKSAVARADLFSAPIVDDYDFLRQALGPRFRARYAQLNYVSVEDTFRVGASSDLLGGDILVGNSATATNNHAEVLRLLAGLDLGSRKVVVPLSYGDPAYRDAIVALGRELLGERFEPLTGFLPLAQYNLRIARCSCAIMNQRRQQAIGNIGTALYLGMRVYLEESGVLYRFFRAHGAHIFSTRELASPGAAAFEPLGPTERARNRAMLESLWSDKVVRRNAGAFVEAARTRK